MATPIATPNWVTQFQINSVTNQTTYSIVVPVTQIGANDIAKIEGELKRQGYVSITTALRIVIP